MAHVVADHSVDRDFRLYEADQANQAVSMAVAGPADLDVIDALFTPPLVYTRNTATRLHSHCESQRMEEPVGT